jgi:hypothetical protein
MGVPSWKVSDKVISFRARHRSKLFALQTLYHPQHEVDLVEEGLNDSVDGRRDTPPVGAY